MRLRIRDGDDSQPTATQSCGAAAASYGQSQDYNINIVDNPVVYLSSTAKQNSNVVAPGTTDAEILRIPVLATGCGAGTLGEMNFNTTGTTDVADIVSAKLYKTGNSNTFNTANLLGTVSSPSGSFSFTGLSDVLLTGATDTNNYWLAYEISSGATYTNIVDAEIDNIYAVGAYHTPSVTAPSGSRTINAPMSFVSVTTVQNSLSSVETSSSNNDIIQLEVVTSAVGSPIDLTSLDIAATGTTSLSDITNLKVWYTGTSSTFATGTQFGTTIAAPGATQAVTGTQALSNGTNYFWVTYDIPSGATIGNVVDAEITSATIGGSVQTPTITAPIGTRQIRAPYCSSNATSTADEEIWNVTFGSLNNTSTCGAVAPGAGSVAYEYSNYTGLAAPNITRGAGTSFSVTTNWCNTYAYTSSVAIFIDYNNNGSFADAGETVYVASGFTGTLGTGVVHSGTITVPCSASIGTTRMRVVYDEMTGTPPYCGTYSWGETEDYTINIVDNPVTYASSTAIQITNTVAPGATDAEILRVPVLDRKSTRLNSSH